MLQRILLLLQAYNVRHEKEYMGFVQIRLFDDGSGSICFNDDIIYSFDTIDNLTYYLENN